MQKIRAVIASIVIAVGIGLVATVPAAAAGAGEAKDDVCAGVTFGGGTCNGNQAEVDGLVKTIVNILSVIAGIIAIIMIIVSGVKYITSGGDSSKVASAKNTLIFSIVGLVIIALSRLIVGFVLNKVT